MKKCILIIAAVLLMMGQPAWAEPTSTLVYKIADRLVATQDVDGIVGSWADEELYTGTIVAGLVDAYQMKCTPAYKTAAELGGNYILSQYSAEYCNYFGDEAYALMRLSQIQADTCSNVYRAALELFFECVRNQPEGTAEYIEQFGTGTTITNAVYYLAHYTVAAYYVDAADKQLWREALIDYLGDVEDDDAKENTPVTALGAALWALAQTGPLDSTPVWDGITLQDLPGVLQLHRCTVWNAQYTGNFYWRFDHQYGLGYTEDDVYGILGLAASQAQGYDFGADIDGAWMQMKKAVDCYNPDPALRGMVYAHVDLTLLPPSYHYYGGQVLMALGAAVYGGDADLDDDVDPEDLSLFISQWLSSSGGACGYACKIADFNRDGKVDLLDFALLSDNWLKDRF